MDPDLAKPGESKRSISGVVALICSTLGCVAWIMVLALLDDYDTSEQLARSMNAIGNLVKMAVFGSASVVLLIVGMVAARIAGPKGHGRIVFCSYCLALVGVCLGVFVLGTEITAAIQILN